MIEKHVFSTLSDIEGTACDIEQAIAALDLYQERSEEEAGELDPAHGYTVQSFLNRLPMHAAVLALALEKLHRASNALNQEIEAVYTLSRAEPESPAEAKKTGK